MRTLLAVAAVLIALVGAGARAAAEEGTAAPSDPAAVANSLYKRAETEDAAGDYAHAAPDYRAAVATLPSSRFATKASTRATLLEAHAEGNWVPYAKLESVRNDPKAARDDAAIDALSAAADAFPDGPTRAEAHMLCAEAYVSRLGRRRDGEAALRKVTADVHADGLLRRQAASELVTALIDDGDLEVAQATVAALGRTLDRTMGQHVTELIRRRRVHLGSVALLSTFALLAAVAIGRAAARGTLGGVGIALRKLLPLALVLSAYTALVGAWLASGYETGNATPFLAFGAVLLPISAAATAWGAAGSVAASARTARAVLSAGAVVAAAFLALEAINGQYLEAFKL